MKKIAILVIAAFLLSIVAIPVMAGDNGYQSNLLLQGNKKGWGQNHNPLGPQIDKKVKKQKFSDIDNDWGREEIETAFNKGFMKGYGNGTFQPNKPLTCLEVIAALVQFEYGADYINGFDTEEYEGYLKKIPAWAWEEVAIALDEGILMPAEMKNFNPNQGIKRYQVAVYIERMYGDESDWDFDNYSCDKEAIEEALEDITEDFTDLNEMIGDKDGLIDLLEDLDDEDVDEILDDIDELDLEEALEKIEEDIDAAEDCDDLKGICDDIEDLLNELEALLENIEDLDIDDDDIKDELEDVVDNLKEIQAALEEVTDDLKCQQFADQDQIPFQARNAAQWVQRWRVMNGDTDGKFSPMRVVKRNEIAAILNRMDINCPALCNSEVITGEITDISEDDGVYTLTVDEDDYDTAANSRLVFIGEFDDEVDLEGMEARIVINDDGKATTVTVGELDDELRDILKDNEKVTDDIDKVTEDYIRLDNGDEYDIDEDTVLMYSGQFVPVIDVEDYEATLYLDNDDEDLTVLVKIVD